MLMIWSSRARNRSFDLVVSRFFGRIVPSDAAQNHAGRFTGTSKVKLQGSGHSALETVQSTIKPAGPKSTLRQELNSSSQATV
jgi:hypothetical protein